MVLGAGAWAQTAPDDLPVDPVDPGDIPDVGSPPQFFGSISKPALLIGAGDPIMLVFYAAPNNISGHWEKSVDLVNWITLSGTEDASPGNGLPITAALGLPPAGQTLFYRFKID